jgi:PTS system nitrogen regulatory IIA component
MPETDSLIDMIRGGGVYYNVSGETPEATFADAVKRLMLPPGVDRGSFLVGLCEREKLMTTAIGYGIAVPHPRTALVSRDEDERVYVCFLDKPVNFGAMDGKPVHTLFVILSSGSSSHLRILSRLSWLLQQEGFRDALRKKPDTEELVSVLKYYSQGVSHHEQRT